MLSRVGELQWKIDPNDREIRTLQPTAHTPTHNVQSLIYYPT